MRNLLLYLPIFLLPITFNEFTLGIMLDSVNQHGSLGGLSLGLSEILQVLTVGLELLNVFFSFVWIGKLEVA